MMIQQERSAADPLDQSVPFYLNGWTAFSEHPELLEDAAQMKPYFLAHADHTRDILLQARTAYANQLHASPSTPSHTYSQSEYLLDALIYVICAP